MDNQRAITVTTDELQMLLGQRDIQIYSLEKHLREALKLLDEAQKKIAELNNHAKTKPPAPGSE